jgi:subtilisin family serine protease
VPKFRAAARALAAVSILAVVFAATAAAPSASTEPAWDKLTAPARALVLQGGYGDFPIAQYVDGHAAGTAYTLVRHSGAQDAELDAALAAAGAKVRFRFPEIGVVAVSSPVTSIGAISQLARVTRVDLDKPQELLAIRTQTLAGVADQAKRGTSDVGADTLWEQGITGKGVVLGVADSGIDGAHPDLDDLDWLTWSSPVNAPKIESFVDCTTVVPFADARLGLTCSRTSPYDDHGHGSHVSGIAAGTAEGGLLTGHGKLPGMAPEATLTGAKVCLAAGSCLNSSVMAGFRWLAVDKAEGGGGADVVNASLGGGRFYLSPLYGAEQVTNNDDQARLVNAMARTYNVLYTISAGNSGPVLQSVGNPSVSSQALSVAAGIADWDLNHPTAETEHGVYGNIRPAAAAAGASALANFSSRGPSGDRLIKPEVVAPGSFYVAAESTTGAEVKALDSAAQNRYSPDPTYAVLSGTSMSAPAAAGAASLVIDGYRRYTGGSSPAYYRVKAALANTATTRAWEGTITGLTSSVRVKVTGEDPSKLRPIRNAEWVGVTGEGSGRIHAPAALLALTQGVLAYTPADTPGFRDLQPNWSMDVVSPGTTASQSFLLWGAPGLANGSKASFSVESGKEALGVAAAPASWFAVPKSTKVVRGAETPVTFRLNVPSTAKPGMYAAAILAKVKIGSATQNVRIPVQFSVDVQDTDPADGAQASLEGPVWASDTTDYTAVGFYGEDIYTDWVTYPVRIPAGTDRVDFSVYDTAGADHMDVFVFDDNGQEVNSTVTPYLDHAVPAGALYTPTSQSSPNEVSILDGHDLIDLVLPTTVWVAVGNSGPTAPSTFRTFHLDVDLVGAGSSGGATPAERIHSGAHAWWGGSAGDASSHLTRQLAIPAGAAALKFWSWYQLEDGFDWAFALVSTDGGATWTSLPTTAAGGSGTTPVDPIGTPGLVGGNKPYEHGLTGTSGQPPITGANLLHPVYVEQTADVSAYAGRTVLLRFHYSADPATNYEGFYVDDVSIVDGTGAALFSDDMETNAGWTPGGTPGFAWVTADAS